MPLVNARGWSKSGAVGASVPLYPHRVAKKFNPPPDWAALLAYWRTTLTDLADDTGGPARYVRISETGGKLGFITPMTHNFCESCNRVRITCTGTLHTCLGHEDASDLRKPLRASSDNDLLSAAIDRAIGLKPKGHDFIIDRRHNRPSVSRHMSVTGG